jgi:hypothetical protein
MSAPGRPILHITSPRELRTANIRPLNAGGTQGKGKAAMPVEEEETSGLSSVVSSSSSSSGSLKERRLKKASMSSKHCQLLRQRAVGLAGSLSGCAGALIDELSFQFFCI